jgi:hypothetical protein
MLAARHRHFERALARCRRLAETVHQFGIPGKVTSVPEYPEISQATSDFLVRAAAQKILGGAFIYAEDLSPANIHAYVSRARAGALILAPGAAFSEPAMSVAVGRELCDVPVVIAILPSVAGGSQAR